MFNRISKGFVLRRYGGVFGGVDRMGLTARSLSPRERSGRAMSMSLYTLIAVALLVLAATAILTHPIHLVSALSHVSPFVGLLGVTAPAVQPKTGGTTPQTPAGIREMERNIKAIAKELQDGLTEMAAGPLPQGRGEELEQKAHEMEELQTQVDLYHRIAGVEAKSRLPQRATLPGEPGGPERKRIVTTPGHLFVLSKELRAYQESGKAGWSGKVSLRGAQIKRNARVTLHGEDALEFERKAFDSATLSSLGSDAIIPRDLDPEIVRFAEPEILTIRQFFTNTPTTSDTVRTIKHTATSRNAGSQASRGDAKNYLKVTMTAVNIPVETIAVLSKVTEQDVDDAPRLVGYINGEMTLDVKVEEERQLTWGDGQNGNLTGLFDDATGIDEFDRSEPGDTLIDTIRRMRTDLRKRRVQPNFVAIDPLDWETVELAKGSTEYYIWGLVSDMRGPRIWSLPAVESDAMTNLTTGERRVLVGDGIRGATIYDRAQTTLAVGYVDDDFARNLRTLRCEERLGMNVKRNFAFEYTQTEEPAS